jgi:hypothetical protein
MMVMCCNHSSKAFVELVIANPGRLGWLIGPIHFKQPRKEVPFALDNDAYIHFSKGTDFDYIGWLALLDKVKRSKLKPLWVAVPDVVADRAGTLASWKRFAPVARLYEWPLAFVVQDGMTPRDVPKDAAVVFVGGSTQWKWRNIPMWCEHFQRVHVGRCGTSKWKLDRLQVMGVESCDGSGWMRDTIAGRNARQLLAWLDPKTHQTELTL